MNVCLLALDGMITTSISLPMEMFTAANHMHRAKHRHRSQQPLKLLTVGTQAALEPVSATGGLRILPDTTYQQIEQASVIFIPSFWRNTNLHGQHWCELCQWLIRQHQQGAQICATGSGVFLLAATGLLDGRPATTHWYYFDQLLAAHPTLQLKKHHLLTQADRLYCAGSVNSVADLTIHLIKTLFGQTIALRVSQQFSPEIRRQYSAFFDVFTHDSPHQDETIAQIQQWLQQNQDQTITMGALAEVFSMSQRTLNRRFVSATGFSPLQWLLRLRIERARDMLAVTNLEIGDIALRCGFQDAGYFSRMFRKQMETTPQLYRASVRSKLFTP